MGFNEKGRAASLFCFLLSLSACASDSAVRGRLYWGHEARSFHPCGSQSAYWVKADERTLHTLRAQAAKPYSPLYVEGHGEIDTQSKREGFARNYDGLLHLRQVTRVSDIVPKECS
jgi:hypothetical protein